MKEKIYYLTLTAIMIALLFTSASCTTGIDERIALSAKDSYVFNTFLTNDDITIQSKDGFVTLIGTVSEESHKLLAQETVSSLPGVKGVDNQLKLTNKDPDESTNAWLITKVKLSLLFHRNVSTTSTEVFSKNGTVTLRGEADNEAQKDLTTEYAMDVEGVKKVINEMTISNAGIKPDKETMGDKMDSIGGSIDDASITAMVKSTLMYHRSTSALKTTVETKGNVVTLKGKAKNLAEKDLATRLVSDVHGVKSVVNKMVIAKTLTNKD